MKDQDCLQKRKKKKMFLFPRPPHFKKNFSETIIYASNHRSPSGRPARRTISSVVEYVPESSGRVRP